MFGSTRASATAEPAAGHPTAGIRAWLRATGVARLAVVLSGRRLRARVRSVRGWLGLLIILGFLAVAAFADILAKANPLVPIGPPLAAPSVTFPLGTDDLGRDLLSGLVHGIRTTVLVAVGVGLIVLPLGVGVGAAAGAIGGRFDDLVMRVSELWQVLPRFFLAVMVIALFGPGIDRMILVLALTSWALLARVVRVEILSIREREFVEAARAVGCGELRILVRHMLPHAMPAAIVYFALLIAQVILVEASLGFLGLGDPNSISLGYLAGQAQGFLRVAWWMWFFPGAALILVVIGLNLVADAINDSVPPRH
jgi:peptide/nickel transport system permease protein